MDEERVLSYGDVLLRRGDVRLLEGDEYLNDRIIDFYLTYLSKQLGGDDSILMVSPSTAFWIAKCTNAADLAPVMEPLKMKQRQMILFPVNDNEELDVPGGGNHWSLLVYHRPEKEFVHFDSSMDLNNIAAKALAVRAASLLGCPDGKVIKFRPSVGSPQQSNSFDCGIYVMAIAKVLSETSTGDDLVAIVNQRVTHDLVSGMRKNTLELIESLSRCQ